MVSVILENSAGQILIHRRALVKSSHPGIRENAAGGGVKASQTYEEAAYGELKEEIGVDDVKLEFIKKSKVVTKSGEKFCGWFKGKCDRNISEFELEPAEVAKVKWVDKNWLLNDQRENPDKYMPSANQWSEIL